MNEPCLLVIARANIEPEIAGLRVAGFRVIQVERLFRTPADAPPDLVILDEAADPTLGDVRQRWPGQPVLLLVDRAPHDAPADYPDGVRTLGKPVSPGSLRAAVAMMLGGPGRADARQLLDDGGRVMVLEPDPARAARLQDAIELEGLDCEIAASVAEACQRLMAARPDVMVLTREDQAAPLRAFAQTFGQDVPMVWLPPCPPPADGAELPAHADDPAATARALAQLLDAAGP